MSEVSTLLAWLIPCLIIALAVVGWRIYVYKTRGPFLPSYLQRNIFERTRSFQPKTPATTSNNDSSSMAPGAIRNETRLDMPGSQQQMSSVSSTPSTGTQSFAPVPCTKKAGASIPSNGAQPPVSPAISRVLNMK
ncbi:hypothetical protein KVV02_007347 [Mortierella alpina]|uniref:Uncharacterized protein n=1 Tax=Mortierella alpina TaxID=64518 RepID=A0A9P8CZF0_MORAP|nr:hypothetical protein KVV02_007347 [Mortierella alpina]